MTEQLKTLISLARSNPQTTILGIIALALGGAGETLQENGVEPWGTILLGICGVVVLVASMIARDPEKQAPKTEDKQQGPPQ